MDRNPNDFKSLGHKVNYDPTYNKDILECFENEQENEYIIKLDCFEFTSLCPITHQPDFGCIKIAYVPDKYCVESKSLKLYLFSFRNTGIFHEDVVNVILNDFIELLNPKYLEVTGEFNSRGGISIKPYANYGIENTKFEEIAYERMKSNIIG